MSTLARRLAANGYAVLAIEARGHGANRNPFAGGRPDHLAEEFGTAVSFLRASPHVDGDRLAVMGHSMGAAAALDYATRNSGLKAAVMIAGGFGREGALRPPNALFIYAERDPQWLREASDRLAEGLRAELGGAAGDDFTRGTAVRVISVPGHDHVTILWSGEAAREIVGWVDASFGIERSGPMRRNQKIWLAAKISRTPLNENIRASALSTNPSTIRPEESYKNEFLSPAGSPVSARQARPHGGEVTLPRLCPFRCRPHGRLL